MSDKTSEGPPRARLPQDQQPPEAKLAARNDRRAHQKAITQGLRKFYDSVAAEPVPREFMELLKKLDDENGGHA